MTPATIHDTARAIARARWLELRCFEILGGWVPTTAEHEVKLAFARQSHHHAWHAELFARVQPTASGLEAAHPDEPPPGWSVVLGELEGLTSTADRLAGAYSVVLPAKLAEYEGWLAEADPVRDAPLCRWLGFVLSDERADLLEGRALVDGIPGAERAPGRTSVAAALAAAGPLLG